MKKCLRITPLILLGMFIYQQGFAQSKPFYNRWTFSTINGATTKYKVYTSIQTKEPNAGGVGRTFLYDGEPSASVIDQDVFPYVKSHIGEFLLTGQSSQPIPFIMDYGFDNVDGDQRIVFDAVTVAFGDYKVNETLPQSLSREDISYDCNIVAQNCRVYQRHYFNFDRSQIFRSALHPYVKSVIIRYHMGGKIAKTMILPIAIIGSYQEYLSTGPGPIELYTILRAAPGDQSRTFMNAQTEVSSEVTMSLSETNSSTSTTTAKASVGFAVKAFSAGASTEYSSSTTNSATNSKGNTYNVTYRTVREIVNDNAGEGDFSDIFVAQRRQYDYGLEYNINARTYKTAQKDYIQLQPQAKMLIWPLTENPKNGEPGGREDKTFSEKYLLSTEIPDLERQGKYSEAKFWKDAIKKNNELKAAAMRVNPRRTIEGNSSNTESEEVDRSSSFTISQEVSIAKTKSISIEAEVGFDVGFASASASLKEEKSWTFSTTSSKANTSGKGSSITTGYRIYDDENNSGDRIFAKMWHDNALGTPVWALDESRSSTSCPYEGGIQLDQPAIFVIDPVTKQDVKIAKKSDLKLDSTVVFDLKVKNKNTTSARTYVLRYVPGSGRPDVIIAGGVNGVVPPFVLAPGATENLLIKISNADPSRKQAYKDMLFILEAKCGGYESGGYVADTVLISAYYGDTDANRVPDNNFITSALLLPTDGSLVNTYKGKSGIQFQITNKNATSTAAEQTLVPTADCVSGWCSETTAGKPEVTNSVWFKFVVTTPSALISTCYPANGDFDSQIAVFKVGNISNPTTYTRLGANDKKLCSSNLSKVSLTGLTLGDTLYVLVDGFQGSHRDFGISVQAQGPPNDLAINPTRIGFVKGEVLKGFYNYAATIDEAENDLLAKVPSEDGSTGWKDADPIQHSVWFSFQSPAGGEAIIEVLNATFDTQIAVVEGIAGDPAYFRQMDFFGANDDISLAGGFGNRLLVKGLDPKRGNYKILVDGYKGAMGYFDLKVSIPVPENDEPCKAIALETDATGQGVFSNGGASATAAEQAIAPPTVALNAAGGWSDAADDTRARRIEHSVWFKFVAPSGGAVTISTCNQASFQAQMAVYRTTDCTDFSKFKLIAADDNSQLCRLPPSNEYPNGTNKRGSILNLKGLEADSTYYILIDGGLNVFGEFSIDIITTPSNPPANDVACQAIALPTNGVIQKGYTNMGATASKTEYKIVPKEWKDSNMGGTVWFKFVAPASGEAEISTCDLANFDTQLAVYSVADCKIDSNFVLIGANEDGPSSCSTGGDSFLPLKGLKAGQTYYLVVDGYGNNKGNFSIVIRDQITPGPVNDNADKAILIAVDGQVKKGYTNAYASVQEKEQDIRPKSGQNQDCTTGWCDNQVDNSVWFKFVAPADGKANISTCDLAAFDTQLAVYSVNNEKDLSTFILIAANDAGPDDCSTNFDSYLPVTGLKAGQTYYVMVDGFDGASGSFDISITGVADTQAPGTPTNLTAADVQTTSVAISWTASTDNVGVKEYVVYVDGTQKTTTSDTKYTITGLTPATEYSITVVAKDAAGNASSASGVLKVTTSTAPDTQTPSTPTNLTASDITATSVKVTWGASTDNVGVKEYRVYLDAALKGTTAETNLVLSGLTAATAYSIYVVAVDAAGNASSPSTALKVTTQTATVADTQAPTNPSNLIAAETNATEVKVSWNASTDNVGVTQYRVFLDNVQKATSTTTSATISGLTATTAYSIHVVAADAAGNTSGSSNVLKVTTASDPISLILSTNPGSLQATFKVYPNPFKNEFTLELPAGFHYPGSIEVRDILGRLIKKPDLSEVTQGRLTIDLTSQPLGVFFLIVREKEGTFYKQVLKNE